MAAVNRKQTLILGGSFAGLTVAHDLRRLLKGQHDVTIIDRSDKFIYIPSLIWVPFGRRSEKQISFPLRPTLESKGIRFLHAEADKIDVENKSVTYTLKSEPSKTGEIKYDYLVIATGPHVEFESVKGLGPDNGYTQSVCDMHHSLEAKDAWDEFVKSPGPVIVGATQGAACYGAAYEFVFNLEYFARKAGIRNKTPVTYITSEPFAGHFGIGGLKHGQAMTEAFFKMEHIDWVVNGVIDEVGPSCVRFKQGQLHKAKDGSVTDIADQCLPFRYSMIIPPFLGVKIVRDAGLGNGRGFVPVNDYFQHVDHPEIYGAGVSVAVASADATACSAGCAVPKTGYISEVMARYTAINITKSIQGQPLVPKPTADIDAKCVLDAGNMGIIMFTDRVYTPKSRKHQILIPGPWAHWLKIVFEQYFLWKLKAGYTNLP